MSDQDESQSKDQDDQQDDDEEDEQRERAFDLNDPTPEPGLTAPLHHVTDEEEKRGSMGTTPIAGPKPDDEAESEEDDS
jgi:hypothetical protein